MARLFGFVNISMYHWGIAAGLALVPLIRDGGRGVVSQSVVPGSSKAILLLPEGRSVELGEAAPELDGMIDESRTLSYLDADPAAAQTWHTLKVPRGGEYKFIIADGTTVWLNSDTEIRYPNHFAGDDSRTVELTGEAFFDVAADAARPFIVKTAAMEITVLGTEFNVSAYPSQNNVSTTLVSGSIAATVAGHDVVTMSPGHHLNYDTETRRLEYAEVNTLPYTAWREGKFAFYHESMEVVAGKLARWYDVEIEFESDDLRGITIFGIVSRDEDIDRVLDMIRRARLLDFKRRGNKVRVLPFSE